MTKIVYHHRIRSKDGQYVHVSELVGALQRQQATIVMVGPEATEQASFGDDGGLVGRLKSVLPRWLYELLELGYGGFATFRLWRAVRHEKPDAIYERYNLHTPAGVLVSWLTKIPVILEVNAPLAEERARHDGLAMPRLAKWVEDRIWCRADAVVAVTDVLADRIRAAGVNSERLHVMPNGIDPRCYLGTENRQANKAARGWQHQTVLGFIGFVRAWHGLDDVIDWLAAREQSDVLLVIAGDGPHNAVLKEKARSLGIASKVVHLGLVERQDVPQLLSAFDIALQPAAVDYASPLKLIEYMAAGCAIVAPDQPNIREVALDGSTALLFEPGRLTQALEALVNDRALRERLGNNAEAAIDELGLTWDDNARRVLALLVQLGEQQCHADVKEPSKTLPSR